MSNVSPVIGCGECEVQATFTFDAERNRTVYTCPQCGDVVAFSREKWENSSE